MTTAILTHRSAQRIRPHAVTRHADLELAQAAAKEDPCAQKAVLTRADAMLRPLAVRLVGRSDAEDLLQEARAWLLRARVLASYQGRGSFDGFLRVVGSNAMFSAHRRAEVRSWRNRIDLVAQPREPVRPHHPDTVNDDLADRLQAALDALPRRAQQVVLAVAVLDLSYKEVALALGIPIGTVGSTYWRALRTLRAGLSDHPVPHTAAPKNRAR